MNVLERLSLYPCRANRRRWHGRSLAGAIVVLLAGAVSPVAATEGPAGRSTTPTGGAAEQGPAPIRTTPAAPGAFRVAVFGESFSPGPVAAALNADPRIDAAVVDRATVEAGLPGYRALLARFGSTLPTPALAHGVRSFLDAGGGYVGEWWGAGAAFSGLGRRPSSYFEPKRFLYLFAGEAAGGGFIASNHPIRMTHPSPVTAGLPGVVKAGGATEFFVQALRPRDPELRTVATYVLDGDTYPAIMVGEVDDARVALLLFDAGDEPFDVDIQRLLTNAVYWAASGTARAESPAAAA